MTKLEEFLQKSEEIVRRIYSDFTGESEFTPMWHLQTGNGDNLLVCTPFDGPDQKEMVAQALREFFKEKNIIRYMFMCEVWFKVFNKGEKPGGEIRYEPDKKEALMISGEDRYTGESIMVQLEIKRVDGKPNLLEGVPFSDGALGRFVNMFVNETIQ